MKRKEKIQVLRDLADHSTVLNSQVTHHEEAEGNLVCLAALMKSCSDKLSTTESVRRKCV